MLRLIRISKYFFIFSIAAILLCTSCASTKKNTYYEKRQKASRINATQLGRNKYFFSPEYQKKLVKSYKRRRY
ncbi:MAG: hypothetical protein K0B05_04155 [Bacteroidales bacterium]|nr:hypothetical protein [Bacteroidales bacterium]